MDILNKIQVINNFKVPSESWYYNTSHTYLHTTVSPTNSPSFDTLSSAPQRQEQSLYNMQKMTNCRFLFTHTHTYTHAHTHIYTHTHTHTHTYTHTYTHTHTGAYIYVYLVFSFNIRRGRDEMVTVKQNNTKQCRSILIIKANKMHYFSNLFR
jgi:hypothetical protein